MFSTTLNKMLPIFAVAVSSCATLKTLEAGYAWSTAFNALLFLYSVAVTMSRMK